MSCGGSVTQVSLFTRFQNCVSPWIVSLSSPGSDWKQGLQKKTLAAVNGHMFHVAFNSWDNDTNCIAMENSNTKADLLFSSPCTAVIMKLIVKKWNALQSTNYRDSFCAPRCPLLSFLFLLHHSQQRVVAGQHAVHWQHMNYRGACSFTTGFITL